MERMLSERKLISLCNHYLLVLKRSAEKVFHHRKRLFGCDYHGIRISLCKVNYISRVVWLHVLDNKVVWLSVSKHLCDIIKPLVREIGIDGVHNSDLLVYNGIRIVGHSVGNNVLSLKKIDLFIVYTYIFDVVGNCHFSHLCTIYFL